MTLKHIKEAAQFKKEVEAQTMFVAGLEDLERDLKFWVGWAKNHSHRLNPKNASASLRNARELVNELLLANVDA